MSDQFSTPAVQPTQSALTTIKLWSPTFIAVSTLFFSFMAGLMLASINCRRMGYPKRVYLYMSSGLAILVILTLLTYVLPNNPPVGALVGVTVFMLYSLSKSDIEKLQPPHSIIGNDSKLVGIGIGIGMAVLTVGLTFAISIFLTILGL